MAQPVSHSPVASSTASQVYADLERSFPRNRARVAALRALADDLERHPSGDETDTSCIVAVVGVLLHGPDAELDASDRRYLAAIGVPPELVRGSMRGR